MGWPQEGFHSQHFATTAQAIICLMPKHLPIYFQVYFNSSLGQWFSMKTVCYRLGISQHWLWFTYLLPVTLPLGLEIYPFTFPLHTYPSATIYIQQNYNSLGTDMSFFNLTHMGYDNTVAESLEQKTTGAAEGSHVKYAALKTKHTRSEKGNTFQFLLFRLR